MYPAPAQRPVEPKPLLPRRVSEMPSAAREHHVLDALDEELGDPVARGDRERLVAVVDEDDLDLAAVVAVDDAGQGVDAVADGQPAARPDESDVAERDLEAQARRHGGTPARRDHDRLARPQVGARGARGAVLGQGAPGADLDGHDGRGVVGFGHRDCLVRNRDRTPAAEVPSDRGVEILAHGMIAR